MTKRDKVLAALATGPKANAQLCDVLDEIGPYVARTMNVLIRQGRVRNAARGRRVALYVLVEGAGQ